MSNNVILNYYLLDPDGTEKFVFKDDFKNYLNKYSKNVQQ